MAQLPTGIWIRAVIVSMTLSAIAAFGTSIVFGGRAYHALPYDSEQVEKMSFGEAVKYIERYSQPMSRWESFGHRVGTWWFWAELLQIWLLLFAFGLLCSASVIWWSSLHRVPSNTAMDPDTVRSPLRDPHGAGHRER